MKREIQKTLSKKKKRVLLAMSGGVDSSVAAALLVREGHDVTGITMRHFCFRKGENPEGEKNCCSLESLEDARKVCDQLGISHYTIDVESEFQRYVVDDFAGEYLRGRTPNPCIRCNQHIRFPWMIKMSDQLGTDRIATGHYARVDMLQYGNACFSLQRGFDKEKDQSYFLWTLDQPTLSRTIFPLGEKTKPGIRELARKFGIDVADKPDSQEICFIPEGDYREFLYRPGDSNPALQPGRIITRDGNELGSHNGVAFYTIGQRRGLGISGRDPLYVIEIYPESRTLVVGSREEIFSTDFEVEFYNWISGKPPDFPLHCEVKIRYRHIGCRATILPIDSGVLRITFEKPQDAITPGQSAVFYSGEQVLGGGIIKCVKYP
jgi:tRNA-specific 2-thiouridylase